MYTGDYLVDLRKARDEGEVAGGNPRGRAFLSRGAGVLAAKPGSAHVLTWPGLGWQPSPRRLGSGRAALQPARATLTTLAGCISLRDIRVGRPL